jgi:DNA-binding response OmpR family regulator
MSPTSRSARPLVLIAEDDAEIQLLLGIQLGRAGFETTIVADGKEALRIALAGAPDLVVLDLALPEIDGLTVLEQIRANEETSGVPVVLLSANAQESQIRDGLLRGANAYVTKPFRFEELLTAIKQALDRP